MKSVIYRCTYRHLYLFQKTLQETGQSVMAATVPVKLQTNNAGPQECLAAETAFPLIQSEMIDEGTILDQRLLTYLRDP